MLQDDQNFDVDAAFELGLSQAGQLWARLGVEADFRGKDVLEVGSGLGFLTADIALAGAKSVLGVDIWEPRVAFGARKLAERFPHLTNAKFSSTPTDKMEGHDRFDVIVSQNTFEHIADIEGVLASFERLLKPGGVAYLGFSPLYHSPFGDHGELRAPARLPWLHLLAGRKRVIAAFNSANDESVTTLPDCGYNGLKPADFRRAFERSGLVTERIRINATEGRLKQAAMNGFSALAKVQWLEPYFTIGMYVTLRKPEVSGAMAA
ncbi:MAG TPA: class I SAM-dependent methyltransferase [Caulobacteraceae bacterium]|nr:class I SAM-dependent methyltransferase [Caulobacteraceae bacterium]